MKGGLVVAANISAVVLAVGLGLLGLVWSGQQPAQAPTESSTLSISARVETHANGEQSLRDASGRAIPVQAYQRIASGSTIADALLLEFASPNQIVAFTTYSDNNEWFGYRYDGKPHIDATGDIESLIALSPDLLLVSTLASGARLERLRETGMNVFSLGQMRGVESFLANARAVALLVGRPRLGELYAKSFLRRIESIAASLPLRRRKTAIQLTYYGSKIYGSGRGTSYHDVLTYAGLIDAAASSYHGWPAWSIEQVLELDPEYIVTRTGMGHQLCTHAALSRLQACQSRTPGARNRVVELPDALLNDPGPRMLLSAERLFDEVYGAQEGTP